MTAFCCRGKLIKVYGQKNDQKQGKMKGRKKILLLALFAVATLVFSACSKTQTNNDFSVGGIVITDAEFFEISILVNGIKTDYSLDSSGCFNISHLKSGDVITFSS